MNSGSSGLRVSLVFLPAPGLPSADGPEIAGKLMSISLVVANALTASLPSLTPRNPTLRAQHSN